MNCVKCWSATALAAPLGDFGNSHPGGGDFIPDDAINLVHDSTPEAVVCLPCKRSPKITDMNSIRFQRRIVVTRPARERMKERSISDAMLIEVIDCGETRYRDATHLWAFKSFPERDDNLLCAVLVPEDAVVRTAGWR
jgi:hypothetical protein